MKRHINFIDCTLREGEQTPGVFFSREEKINLLKVLSGLGVNVADVGMPSTSRDEFETIKELIKLERDIKIGVSARAIEEEVDLCLKCGAEEIFLIIPASKLHLEKKLQSSYAKIKELSKNLIFRIKNAGVIVNLVAEDASRADFEFIISLFKGVAREGADRVIFCDTVGIMTPTLMRNTIKEIRKVLLPNVQLGVHCHNDFGLATANTIVAIEEGATFLTGTINGIGERAGNASIQELAMIVDKLLKFSHTIDIKKLLAITSMVEKYSGILISQHSPIVGYNVFRHESGIHVDGIMKNKDTYEPFSPCDVGKKRVFVLGKSSGKAYLKYLLEKKGVNYTKGQLSKILDRVKKEKQSQSKESFLILKEQINNFNENFLGFAESKFWKIVNDVLADNE